MRIMLIVMKINADKCKYSLKTHTTSQKMELIDSFSSWSSPPVTDT